MPGYTEHRLKKKNGHRVDCETGSIVMDGGTITVDSATGEGSLIIELYTESPTHQDAITSQSTLYVDEDLESELFIVHHGVYPFDSIIGENGGYEVPVTSK